MLGLYIDLKNIPLYGSDLKFSYRHVWDLLQRNKIDSMKVGELFGYTQFSILVQRCMKSNFVKCFF